jgi:hypothetical protein
MGILTLFEYQLSIFNCDIPHTCTRRNTWMNLNGAFCKSMRLFRLLSNHQNHNDVVIMHGRVVREVFNIAINAKTRSGYEKKDEEFGEIGVLLIRVLH